jgi:hypothetical protein
MANADPMTAMQPNASATRDLHLPYVPPLLENNTKLTREVEPTAVAPMAPAQTNIQLRGLSR